MSVQDKLPADRVVEVVGFQGGAFGEVQALGRGLDGADYVGCETLGLEAPSVVGGKLKTVEQGGGALDPPVREGD
jgi:hypothetical protein